MAHRFVDRTSSPPARSLSAPWLLLLYQLPARPSNARVKTWRRLQRLGALAVRNSGYLLPHSPQAREDFEWVKAEITAMGGQATVLAADTLDALSRDEIVAGFRAARRREYEALVQRAERLLRARTPRRHSSAQPRGSERAVRSLRQAFEAVRALDFFQAEGKDRVAAALASLERPAAAGAAAMDQRTAGGRLRPADFRNRVWITRPRPGIDRMGCAWLIRRFIDPRARFRFAAKAEKTSKLVPFDMFGAEFGHQGEECSFETLARAFAISDPTVGRLAQIVHALDLKDDKFSPPEAAATGRVVEGLRQMHSNDGELLDRGAEIFEALYRSLSSQAATHKWRTRRARRTSRRKRAGVSR